MIIDVDLAVVGLGAAGMAAAITASRLGASVAVIEKQSSEHHLSSTRMSGGLIMAATDVDACTRYLDACSGGMIPTAVNRTWSQRAVDAGAWLRSVGIETVVMAGGWHPGLDGFDSIEVLAPLPRGVDPSSVDIELPPPGELAFKGKLPFGNGEMLHDQLLDALRAEPNILWSETSAFSVTCSQGGAKVIEYAVQSQSGTAQDWVLDGPWPVSIEDLALTLNDARSRALAASGGSA